MELSGLVRTGAVVVRFLAIGAVLVGVRLAVGAVAPVPVATVEVGPGEDVEEAVLVDQGRRMGWVHTDPVIRRRLADNLRFSLGVEGSDDALFDRAVRLGMDRSDPVVRRRLADRARTLLDDPGDPSAADLAAVLAASPERFRVPARLDVEHRFAASADGLDEGEHLAALGPRATVTAAELDARLGAGVGEAVAALSVGAWSEPIPSALGWHRFRVVAVAPSRVPALAEIRGRVAAVWRAEARERVGAERRAALRERVRIAR